MKNRKLGIFLWIFGGVVLMAGVIGIILYFALAPESGEKNNTILIVSIVGIAVSFILLIPGYILSFKADKDIKNRIALYSSYPVQQIGDYKKELDAVRANFNADADPAKNQIAVFNFINSSRCFDFSVIKNGKIYYAYLVRAFPPLYSDQSFARMTLPAVIVYGTDEFFESNPMALKKIAQKFYAGRNSNILRDDSNFFTNVKLPDEITDGREVYATTVMVYRMHLPLCYLSDSLFPIIADPEKSTSAFIVDFKYWTKAQTGNFAHAVAQRTVIKEQQPDGVFDL